MKDELIETFKERQKRNYGKVLAVSLSVGVITLAVLLLQWFIEGAFIGFTLIVALPLIIIPFLVCAIIATTRITREPDYNYRTFYSFYMMGLAGQIRSAFRPLVNFLKSYLILIVISLLGFLILYFIPDYHAEISKFFDTVRALETMSEIYEATDAFLTSDLMFIPYTIIINTSYGAAFFYFVYSLLGNTLYANCKMNAMLPNGRKKPVFKEVFAKYKKDYYITLFKTSWYYFFVPIIGFILSVILCMVYGAADISLLVAVLVTIILFIPVLPNVLILNDVMFDVMGPELQIKNASYITDMLKNLTGNQAMSDEEKEALDKLMNEMKEKGARGSIDVEFKESEQEDNQDDSNDDKNIEDK